MKLELLLGKLDHLADVPDAINNIRELVLQFAVRGRLTAQRLHESVDSQLNAIGSSKSGVIRKHQDVSPEAPFGIPQNWSWVAIGDTMELINGRAFKSEEWTSEGTRIVRIQNLNNESASFNRCQLDVDPKVHINDGDLLISWSGTPGTSFGAFIWNRGFAYLNQHIFRCKVVEGVFEKNYLRLAVNARLDEMISHAQGGVGLRHITKGNLERILLPLPPLREQARIVAKVNGLMESCDRLVDLQKERRERQVALDRAAVARFKEASTSANLSFLFHDSYSIAPAELRKVILNQAVCGKLVPQNPNDGTGEEMLKKASITDAKIGPRRKSNQAAAVLTIENLPPSWSIRPLCDLVDREKNISYGVLVPGDDVPAGIPFIRVQDLYLRDHPKRPAKSIAPEVEAPYSRTRLFGGEILLCVVGSIGKLGIVPESWAGANIARAVARIRTISEILPDYLLLVLQDEAVQAYFRSSTRTLAQPTLNIGLIEQTPIPVPPLAEQRRIVAAVDRLMTLVDRLEMQLAASDAMARKVLEATVHEMLHPNVDLIERQSTERDVAAERAAISCYAIQSLGRSANFGRTMLMKVCYLSEIHLGLRLGWKPLRQAAGPYDPEIENFESLGKRNGWFTVTEKALNNGHTKIDYHAKTCLKTKAAEAAIVLGEKKSEFDRLLNLFADKRTEEVEIISTLFAAWNDFLIDGKLPTDNDIIREVRENWHKKKERFTFNQLSDWIEWIRRNNLIPKGYEPRTRQQLKLEM